MEFNYFSDSNEVASKAAEDAITTLSRAIRKKGKASWVLAGGSSPMTAYKNIVSNYANALDWSKVTVLIGDERCVPIEHEDSNWGQISKVLFNNELIARSNQLVPRADLGAEEGAKQYGQQIRKSITDEKGNLSFDLLWLGVGEDGHTLSLFPGSSALNDTSDIVIPVHNSPKPPADRITLSLSSVIKAQKIVIFATGVNKRDVLAQVKKEPRSLPIGLVADRATAIGANVLWLYDDATKPE